MQAWLGTRLIGIFSNNSSDLKMLGSSLQTKWHSRVLKAGREFITDSPSSPILLSPVPCGADGLLGGLAFFDYFE